MKNKIGWCDMTWNPVWGCRNYCEYCYARGIAKRFRDVIADKEYKWSRGRTCQGEIANRLRHFVPTLLFSHLYKKLPKKPQKIFIGSMSEINHWKGCWIDNVIERIKLYPYHTYQFLTKFPEIYCKVYDFPKNCWLGVTITKDDDFDNGTYDFLRSDLNRDNIKYISLEPLLGKILSYKLLQYFNWVIIGAESGNRKGKVIPKKEWIEDIISYCRDKGIPIYLKDSLKDIYPVEIKEFPKEEK